MAKAVQEEQDRMYNITYLDLHQPWLVSPAADTRSAHRPGFVTSSQVALLALGKARPCPGRAASARRQHQTPRRARGIKRVIDPPSHGAVGGKVMPTGSRTPRD